MARGQLIVGTEHPQSREEPNRIISSPLGAQLGLGRSRKRSASGQEERPCPNATFPPKLAPFVPLRFSPPAAMLRVGTGTRAARQAATALKPERSSNLAAMFLLLRISRFSSSFVSASGVSQRRPLLLRRGAALSESFSFNQRSSALILFLLS